MKKLLYTTTAFVLCGGIVQANAACIATPSCTTMGYTETSSCDGGLKCPFANYWYCPSGEECSDFPYICVGRGYVDGVGLGADCNGKYAKCECYEGFEWKDGQGCVESSTECKLGAILYSDKTCSSSGYDNDVGNKTAIGVVVYIGSDGKKWAISPKSIGKYKWAVKDGDISGLTNYTSDSTASEDFDSCGNTAKIIAAGNKSTYPAAWAAHEYKTEGTSAGDWCLPAAGIINYIFKNLEAVNVGLKRAGVAEWTTEFSGWSSTESDSRFAWGATFYYEPNIYYGVSTTSAGIDYFKTISAPIFPVLEF